jgi:hypothetical protein
VLVLIVWQLENQQLPKIAQFSLVSGITVLIGWAIWGLNLPNPYQLIIFPSLLAAVLISFRAGFITAGIISLGLLLGSIFPKTGLPIQTIFFPIITMWGGLATKKGLPDIHAGQRFRRLRLKKCL